MYCPVEFIHPLFTLEMNGIQRNKGVFVSPTMLYSIISLYMIRECILIMSYCCKNTEDNVDLFLSL